MPEALLAGPAPVGHGCPRRGQEKSREKKSGARLDTPGGVAKFRAFSWAPASRALARLLGNEF